MIRKLINLIVNTQLGHLLNNIILFFELKILCYYNDKETMNILRQIISEEKPILLKASELFIVYSFAKAQTTVRGDYAEVGVFKGTTAKIICEAKGKKYIHLFDTFEGLPRVSRIDRRFKAKMFKANYLDVRERLSKYENVHIYKGLFPQSASSIKYKKFSFVHLDADLYQSTKDSLNFFYDRISKGGILISHDYHIPGVKKAFNEFFKNKPERIVKLPLSQCFFIKK